MTFRYRALDANGDMTFGRGAANFLVDSPAAVAQAILTRLNLWTGEWWLDLSIGTPWLQQILGKPRGPGSPDAAIRQRILTTPYVTNLTDYASNYNPTNRSWVVSCKVFTAFGQVTNPQPGISVTPSGSIVFRLTPVASVSRETPALAAPQRRLTAPR